MRALLIALLALLVVAVPAAAAGGTTISGRILDTQGGLTVPNATVELAAQRNAGRDRPHRCRRQLSDSRSAPGNVCRLRAGRGLSDHAHLTRPSRDARRFLRSRSRPPSLASRKGSSRSATSLRPGERRFKQRRRSTRTSTPRVIQSENYQRLADVLTTVPGVITSTSSSVGDDMTLSIRGYDSNRDGDAARRPSHRAHRCVRQRLQLQRFAVLGTQRRRRDLRLGRHRPLRSHDDRRRGELSEHQSHAAEPRLGYAKASAATTRR